MKVTLNWLKQYVDFDWSPEQLAERLTMLGLEVEGVQKVAGEFEGIVVAQILTKDNVGDISTWSEPKDALDQFKALWQLG